MNNRFFTSVFGLLIFISLNLKAQPGIVLDSVPAAPTGQTVCIPLKAKGFDLISMDGYISWDTQILNYLYTQNHSLLAFGPYSFKYNPQEGNLLFSWSDPTAICISMDNNELICEICFKVVGPVGSSSVIGIDTATTFGCYIDGNLWTYVESPPILFYVSIATDVSNLAGTKQSTFTLNPNPASEGTQVKFDSRQDGSATLFVANMLGQTLFEEKTSLNIGENQIRIPAEVLRTAGIYQVLLYTEQGVVSQVLVVH